MTSNVQITPPSKPEVTLRQLGGMLGGAFVVANIYYFVLRGGISGLRLLVLNFTLVSICLLLTQLFSKKINRFSQLLIGAIGLISLFSILRSSSLLTFLNTASSMTLTTLLGYSLSGIRLRDFDITDYILSPVITSIAWIGGFIKLWQQMFRVNRQLRTRPPKVNAAVVRGLLLAAPILVIFAALFASADEQFASLFSFNIDFNISTDVAAWVFYVGLLFTVFVGLFTYFALMAKPIKKSQNQLKIGQVESQIVVGSVFALFAGFAMLQISNTLLADTATELADLAPNARQGFAQLVFAAMLLFVLLIGLEKTKFEKKQRMYFLAISGGLIASTYVILASAITRLIRYEQVFGFTLTRFLVHAFIILLGMWLGLLFVKMFKQIKNTDFASALLASAVVFVLALNFSNPDAIITRQNLSNAFPVETDYEYIRSLSTDSFSAFDQKTIEEHPELEGHTCHFVSNYQSNSWLDWNNSEQYALEEFGNC